MSEQAQNQQAQNQQPQGQFALQRIYVKDLSFEVPNAPKVFLGEWKPDVNVDFGGIEFVGVLSFVESLRSLIPLDGFSDPP